MKKLLLILMALFLWAGSSWAQVSAYSFASSSGTYTPLSTETILWSGTFDDNNSAAITIPSITVAGTPYTTMFVQANGWITLGGTSISSSYTPISQSTSYPVVISAFGRDLNNAAAGTPKISYNTNDGGEIVIQYQDVRRYNISGERLSFQIRLNTSNGDIKFVFGGTITGGTSTSYPQVGLRGATNTVYNNRTTTTNWSATIAGTSNTSTCLMSTTVTPSVGLTFSFTPPLPCAGTPDPGNTISSSNPACSGVNFTLSLQNTTPGTGVTYQWQYSPDGNDPWTNLGTAATQVTSQTTATYYRCEVTCSGNTGTSNPLLVNLFLPVTSFTENFDGVVAPAFPGCWAKVGSLGSASTQTTSANSLPNCLYIYSSSSTSLAVVKMDEVSNLGAGTHQLRFNMRAAYTVGGIVQFGYLTNPADPATFVSLGSATASSLTYAEYTIVPAAGSYSTYPAIRHTGVPANSLLIDDVKWELLPTCLPPTGLNSDNNTLSGADLHWTSPDSFFDIFIQLNGLPAPGPGTTPTINDFNGGYTYTWSDGSSNSTYDWWVRADCDAGGGIGQSDWAGPNTFITPSSVPFFDGFETGNTHNVAIAGWTQEAVVGTNVWTANNTFTDYNRTPRTGTWNAFLRYGNTRWMFKAFELTGGITYNFEMYARQDGATAANSNMTVSYGTAGNAAAMTNPIVPVTGIINGNYQLLSGSFSPPVTGVYYIGIMGYMNSSPWYISIDDISITEASTATLSYYNLQYPASATIDITQNETIYAQCWESGVTEPDGPGAGIECWIGYNTTNATVVSDFASGWNWVSTSYNYGHDPSNNDEYMANLGVAQGLSIGTYYYVSRFRYNGGPFTYGGYPNGAWNGSTQVSGVLTVNPLPNDECSGAIAVSCGDAVTGTTNTATLDNVGTCGVTNTYPGVWYMFTGLGDMVSVDLCTGTTWDSKISVFEGPCESLVCVDGNDDYCALQSRVDWFAESGIDYYILVHQYGTTGGAFTITVNCTYPETATWDGGDYSDDWFGADNWDVSDVPGTTTNVIIPTGLSYYPTVDRKGACNNISVGSGARLVDRGAGYLVPGGTATVDRDYLGGEWHLISSPVAGATANMFLGLFLQNHTESTNVYTDITDPVTPLNAMQGYALWNDAAGTASFVGTLNTGNFGSGLTRTGLGWNLVGNPYPSPIDWDALTGWTKTNVDNATYRHVNNATWAEYVGGVGANGGTRYIAGEQGFFVGVTTGFTAGTLSMTNDVSTHSYFNFL